MIAVDKRAIAGVRSTTDERDTLLLISRRVQIVLLHVIHTGVHSVIEHIHATNNSRLITPATSATQAATSARHYLLLLLLLLAVGHCCWRLSDGRVVDDGLLRRARCCRARRWRRR